ncbi:MAG: cupin, partial [Armatimonadota bacterium]
MYKVNVHKMDLQPVTTDGAEDVSIQWLVSEDNGGAPNFAMRRFVVEPGGSTPYHTHDWEHEVYT